MRPYRVLHVSSECAPFAKSGGLGDVVGALPQAQAALGMDVRVLLPLYQGLAWHELSRRREVLKIPMGGQVAFGALRESTLPGSEVPAYFLEHHAAYDRGGYYGDRSGDFGDNLWRFGLLSSAAVQLCHALQFYPDIIHVHDWQASLIPLYLRQSRWGTPLHRIATVLTIHNLGYQGAFSRSGFPRLGLHSDFLQPHLYHHGALNLLKGGITASERVVTVSPTYAQEIQTQEHGAGLEGVMRHHRAKLSGILNGIDQNVWNPETDPHLSANFSAEDLSGKGACKAAVQQELGLPLAPDAPLFVSISRLAGQKGLDYVADALPGFLMGGGQFILLGTGDKGLEERFARLERQFPMQMRALIKFSERWAHLLEAAADFFVMPSRYEPCGMNQMYSLRYGTLPVVHRTGGLADTVENHVPFGAAGNGFVLDNLSADAVYRTMQWARDTYHASPQTIAQMRQNAMACDFGWQRSAEQYRQVYANALSRRRGAHWLATFAPSRRASVPCIPPVRCVSLSVVSIPSASTPSFSLNFGLRIWNSPKLFGLTMGNFFPTSASC